MGVIFLVVIGATLGWFASVAMHQDDRSGTLRNVAVGIAGAFFAGLVLNPLLGGGNLLAGSYHVSALLISLLGSVSLLAVVNLLRRDRLPAENRAPGATKRV